MIHEERLDLVAHAIYTAMRASTMDFTHVLRSSENYDGIRPYERAVFIALAEYAVEASEGKP